MTKDLNVFDKHYGLLINGEWTNGSEGNTLTAYNPANGEALATFIDATDADVDAAVNAAKEAFKTWKNTSATERATILNKIADIIDENTELFALQETLDIVKSSGQDLIDAILGVAGPNPTDIDENQMKDRRITTA